MLKAFKNAVIDTPGVVKHTLRLFNSAPELLEGFKMFMSSWSRIFAIDYGLKTDIAINKRRRFVARVKASQKTL